MATQRIIPDEDFGRIVIRTRRLARNITMRVREDGLYLTVPPYSKTEKILEAVFPFRGRLLEQYKTVSVRQFDFDFSIHAECFHLWLEPGRLKHFTVRQTEEGIRVGCPAGTDFSDANVQKTVRLAIIRGMKKKAEEYLPPLLDFWAGRYGLPYKKVRITGARSRWGSCTAARTISLSCYLMLLPARLMDYVILHELTHTKEMNHGPRFWELLDKLTEGQALRLRAELRKYRTSF